MLAGVCWLLCHPRVRHAPTVLGPSVGLANTASSRRSNVLSLRLGQTTTQDGVLGLALRQDQLVHLAPYVDGPSSATLLGRRHLGLSLIYCSSEAPA